MTDKQLTLPHAKEFTVASFRLHETGLEPIGTPTFDDWLQCGQFIRQAKGAVHFWIGDFINYGESRWGEQYKDAIALTGFDYGTLRNDKWVASRVELSRRRDNLSFDHHVEVADFPPDEQEELLELASKKKMTTRDFRNYLNQLQMKQPVDKKVSGQSDTSPLAKAFVSGDAFLKDLQKLAGSVLTYDEYSQLSDLLQDIGDATSHITYEDTDAEN